MFPYLSFRQLPLLSYLHYNNCIFGLIQVHHILMDGAQCNRSFMKIHFRDPRKAHFTCASPIDRGIQVSFIMDPKVGMNYYYHISLITLQSFISVPHLIPCSKCYLLILCIYIHQVHYLNCPQ